MFEVLQAQSRQLMATPDFWVPLDEQAFARAALTRLTSSLPRIGTAPRAHVSTRRSSTQPSLTLLCGPEGTGKSLLVRQTLREALSQQPKLKILIASACDIAELVTAAVESQVFEAICESFQALDILVCENIEKLESPVYHECRENLFSLLDRLDVAGPRMLLTSRKLPGEWKGFSARWVNRCHGGLCALLPWPTLASRTILMRDGAAMRGIRFRDESLSALTRLAERMSPSPKFLMGELDRLAEQLSRAPALVDETYLERWLSQQGTGFTVTLDAISVAVATEFGLHPEELRSRSRQQGLIVPRQCAMFLARELTKQPLEKIGAYFGERTHTTVSHSLARLKDLLPHAPSLRQQVKKVRLRLASLKNNDVA